MIVVLFSLFGTVRSQVSLEPPQPTQSSIQRDRVENFRHHQTEDDTDIRAMIRTSRPYAQTEFNQPEYSRNEVNNSCEFVPAANMIRCSTLFHGIALYIDRNVQLTNVMMDQAKQLAWLLVGLATQVFQLPIETMHLFRDIDSGS